MSLLEQISTAVRDRYRVERELGHGGMAVVFGAEDLKHHRRVAIKLLKPEISAALGTDRFLREIEIAATLQHPHILPLYDSGQADGIVYYVMPFVEGESLRERLTREVQLPIDDAVQITREVGSALQYAHEHGVVHRDIKPENIMLTGGHAVVLDFGIARALHAAGAATLTQSGMVVGTPQYMSPEQSGGASLDGRTDQYSLACTLFEMLVGQPPFTGTSSAAVLARHALEPVPSVRVVRHTVPEAVEGAIRQAMAKVPADRFVSMERFLHSLTSPDQASVAKVAASRKFEQFAGKRLAIGLGAALLVAAVAWLATTRDGSIAAASSTVRSVAVLPFEESGVNPDSAYLAEGMTDGVIADLARVGTLKVISRGSGTAAMEGSPSMASLASDLGVDAVVKGTIRRVGDSVLVTVRFLHASDSALLFTREYGRRLGELPDLQRQITADLTSSLGTATPAAEPGQRATNKEVDQRAYDAWLRGRFHLERDESEQARVLFEQAVKLAPDWAPPWVGLANYYTALPFSTDVAPAQVLPKARAALAKAIELDERLPEAHAANAYLRAYYDWDWRAAEQEFKRAIELRPNYADAYFSYSRFLASRRRIDEAIVQLGKAVELDPLSLPLKANRALLDYFAGRYGAADSGLTGVLQVDSTNGLALWARALVAEQQGRLDDAIAILEPISVRSLNRKSSLGHVYGMAGQHARARRILTSLDSAAAVSYVPSYYFALVYTGLGDRDRALRYLERAFDERSTVLAYLLIDPRLSSLRDDARFLALAGRLGGE